MDIYETLTKEQKAIILDTLVCASELFTEENLHFLLTAMEPHKQVKKPESKPKTNSSKIVDIFDFEKYKQEHEIMTHFYSDLELVLKTALIIDYKYNHLSPESRGVFKMIISKKTGKPLLVKRDKEGNLKGTLITKKFLDQFTNVFEPYYILKMWYKHYGPSKLEDEDFLQRILKKYAGYEDVALNKIYRKYVDPDWKSKPLWFTAKFRTTSNGKKQTMERFYELYP